MSSGETEAHKNLKLLAWKWAMEEGYRSGGFEITLPNSGYRADLAAYRPATELKTVEFAGGKIRQRHAILGSTAVFECKQARADLFKDSCLTAKASAQLEKWQGRREVIERLLKVHYPSAATADSLFQEYESFDFSAIGHRGHRKVLQEIASLQNAILRKSKFEKLIRYRCANLFYLVTTGNILADYELPLSWGLLVKEGEGLKLVQKPIWLPSSEGARLAILQRIAATRNPAPSQQSDPMKDDLPV